MGLGGKMYKIRNIYNENKSIIIDNKVITIKPNKFVMVKKPCEEEEGLIIEKIIDEKAAKQREQTPMEVKKNGR